MGGNFRDKAEKVFESRFLQVIGGRSENIYSRMLEGNKKTYLTDVYIRIFSADFSKKAEESSAFYCKDNSEK